MKEVFDNDINSFGDNNSAEEIQLNILDDIGIGLNNFSDLEKKNETLQVSNSDELVYKNLEELKTNSNLYKNIETESLEGTTNIDVELKLDEDITVVNINNFASNASTSETSASTTELDISVDESDVANIELNNSRRKINFAKDEVDNSISQTANDNNIGLDINQNINSDIDSDKYVIDGATEQKTPIIGYNFVDVEEKEKEILSGKIEEVTVKENDFISEDIAPYISKGESSKKKVKNRGVDGNTHKKLIRRIGIVAAMFAIIGTSLILVVRSVANKINFTDFSETVEQEEKFDTESVLAENAEVVKVNEFNWDMIKGNPTYDENIYNILIIGGDIAGVKGARGNSDTLIIVSIDKNTKSIKLSSIMRDTYVPIPGYRDNKINSAYATGGVPLVKKVIEENFKVTIDSTVVVNYTTFVKAIDKLGGVKGVVLNGSEARFINRECNKHGHSSNLIEGTHDLDAYQALHFSRIRKISSDIYGSDDFGRTARQRYVINQLFKQYKDLNYAQLAGVLTTVMGELEVDEVLKKDLFLLAQVALKFNTETLGEFRLPMDDAYSFASVPVPGSGQNMSVVKIDDYWQTNVDALHQFIYGTTEY